MHVVSNRHNVQCFEANGPRHWLVPVICYSCLNFDPGCDSTWLGPAEYPECSVLLFFPTRKGTCKRYRRHFNVVISTYGVNGHSETYVNALKHTPAITMDSKRGSTGRG